MWWSKKYNTIKEIPSRKTPFSIIKCVFPQTPKITNYGLYLFLFLPSGFFILFSFMPKNHFVLFCLYLSCFFVSIFSSSRYFLFLYFLYTASWVHHIFSYFFLIFWCFSRGDDAVLPLQHINEMMMNSECVLVEKE